VIATPFTERYGTILLVSILVLAALLRLIALSNWGDSLYADFLLWDERIYETCTTPVFVIPVKTGIQEVLYNTGYRPSPV
jgi:hypothetical protein